MPEGKISENLIYLETCVELVGWKRPSRVSWEDRLLSMGLPNIDCKWFVVVVSVSELEEVCGRLCRSICEWWVGEKQLIKSWVKHSVRRAHFSSAQRRYLFCLFACVSLRCRNGTFELYSTNEKESRHKQKRENIKGELQHREKESRAAGVVEAYHQDQYTCGTNIHHKPAHRGFHRRKILSAVFFTVLFDLRERG